jgi:hypothetical protein
MKVIWQEDEASYQGEFVRFDPIWSYPKPAQKPHPPVIVGGSTAGARRRAVRYGNGWMPIPGRGASIVEDLRDLRALAESAGRDPQTIPVTVFGAPADPKVIAEYETAGVERVLLPLPPAGDDKVLALLDRYAPLLGGSR